MAAVLFFTGSLEAYKKILDKYSLNKHMVVGWMDGCNKCIMLSRKERVSTLMDITLSK